MQQPLQSEDLLARIADQDPSALEEFYDRHHRLVYSLVLRILNEPTQAEEVVLEIFWQIWQQAGRFTPGRLRVATWLAMISRDRALDHLRRTPERLAVHDESRRVFSRAAAPPVDAEAVHAEAQARTALDSLTSVQRQAIEMAYYRGLNHTEIATLLHEPEDLIKSRIQAGLGQIRSAMRRTTSNRES